MGTLVLSTDLPAAGNPIGDTIAAVKSGFALLPADLVRVQESAVASSAANPMRENTAAVLVLRPRRAKGLDPVEQGAAAFE